MRILIVISTYEPYYIHDPELEEFYEKNFDSFLGANGNFELKLAITDFASSRSYKAFLRSYVKDRQDCYLIDGEQEASLQVAINIALINFDYDYVVYSPCDLRARDASWLVTLLKEFDDPKVQVALSTVNVGGSPMCEQNQPEPLDRESRIVALSERFSLVCAVFPREFFQHFGGRYPDIFDCFHTEDCVMYQLAALGYVAKINFRVNMVHGAEGILDVKPGTAMAGWRARNDLIESDLNKFLSRAAHIPFYSSVGGLSLRTQIRSLIIRLKTQGWRYFYYRLFFWRAFDDFRNLDFVTKVAIMKSLFYRPMSDYEKYTYSIYSSNSSRESDTRYSAAPEGEVA